MKKIKLMLAGLMALFMSLTSVHVVSAATTYTLNVTGTTSGHTYEAYQIFSGDLDGSTLSNIKWGSGVDAATAQANLGNARAKAEELNGKAEDAAEAKAFAQAISNYLASTPTKTVQSVEGTTTFTNLEPGYYLIKDKDASLNGAEGAAYTRFILQVVKDTQVAVKSDVPTLKKEVKASDSNVYSSATDYAIGDSVPFQLTATLPSNYDAYSDYELAFNDTLSAGLTYKSDAAVYLVNGGVETNVTDKFTIAASAGNLLTIKAANLKTAVPAATSSSKFVVRYSATLNSNAVTGTVGNSNTANLTYSNNPNTTGGKTTGKTPESKSTVYTYQVVINKVNESNAALPGAGFTLYKKVSGNYVEVKKINAGTTTSFTFKGLDVGDYKLVESTTPAGYNTMEDLEFTVTATVDTTGAVPALTALKATSPKGASFTTDLTNGTLTTSVVNKKGSLLPNTGGIGTTILYVAGTVLVVGAGVLLLARKRMDSK